MKKEKYSPELKAGVTPEVPKTSDLLPVVSRRAMRGLLDGVEVGDGVGRALKVGDGARTLVAFPKRRRERLPAVVAV